MTRDEHRAQCLVEEWKRLENERVHLLIERFELLALIAMLDATSQRTLPWV